MLLGENCIFIAVQSSFTELLIESYIFPTSTANLNIKIEEIKHKPRPKNTQSAFGQIEFSHILLQVAFTEIKLNWIVEKAGLHQGKLSICEMIFMI